MTTYKPPLKTDPLEIAMQAQDVHGGLWGNCMDTLQRLLDPDILLKQTHLLGGAQCPIDLRENDYEFVQHYGLVIDGQSFDWNWYKHLIPVYEDDWPFLTLMAGAQTGKTARLLVHLTRTMLQHWGAMFGYYFPDIHLPKAFSSKRFKPFLKSNPEVGQLLGAPTKSGKGIDNVLTRTLGESVVFFMTTAGKSSTEGLPLKGTYFDEVRRMSMGDIERAMERYSAQLGPVDVKVSTANYPDSDIDRFFREGDQRFFHTDCQCSEGLVLSLNFPDCIMDLRSATPQLKRKIEHAHRFIGMGEDRAPLGHFYPAAYYCPKCGNVLADPREGWWEEHNPETRGMRPHSYQMTQMLSPTFPAGRMLYKLEHARDVQELWNSGVGMPYIDESRRGVTEEQILACVNSELYWVANKSMQWRKQYVKNTAMGVDVQAGYLVAVIKVLSPNGKFRTLHLEVVHGTHSNDPWHSLGQMMQDWDVRLAVIDQAPEWSAALRFAKAFGSRVFLANFLVSENSSSPMISWGDSGKDKKQKGAGVRMKKRVTIEKIKGMKWSLGRWEHRMNEMPDPRGLIQRLPMQGDRVAWSAELRVGRMTPTRIAPEYMKHLTNMMFKDLYKDDEDRQRRGEHKWIVEALGPDHFADANLYADVALSRIGKPAIPRRV